MLKSISEFLSLHVFSTIVFAHLKRNVLVEVALTVGHFVATFFF